MVTESPDEQEILAWSVAFTHHYHSGCDSVFCSLLLLRNEVNTVAEVEPATLPPSKPVAGCFAFYAKQKPPEIFIWTVFV
jgi:hypothetical protein